MRPRIMVVAIAGLVLSGQSAPDSHRPSLEPGRDATRLLLAGDVQGLMPELSDGFRAAIGGEAGLAGFVDAVRAQAGEEREVLEEAAFREAGHVSYYRRSRFEKLPDVTTRWVLDATGTIVAGSVRPTVPPAETTRLDYRTRADMRLPFRVPAEGQWYVAWGGRDAIHNHHVAAPDQRFATDFLVTEDSMPFRTDGKRNEDHYCWNEPILAAAAGRVVGVVDGIADNAPGQENRDRPAGNHVVIDHGGGEYSLSAHLREGSVRVRDGEEVAAGTEIGRCGNSGKSTLPHLHFHLQTSPVFGQGEGLPVLFRDYRVNGEPVAAGEVVRGQTVAP